MFDDYKNLPSMRTMQRLIPLGERDIFESLAN